MIRVSPTPAPVVHVETLQPPLTYSQHQLRDAYLTAYQLDRGRLVYALPPEGNDASR